MRNKPTAQDETALNEGDKQQMQTFLSDSVTPCWFFCELVAEFTLYGKKYLKRRMWLKKSQIFNIPRVLQEEMHFFSKGMQPQVKLSSNSYRWISKEHEFIAKHTHVHMYIHETHMEIGQHRKNQKKQQVAK